MYTQALREGKGRRRHPEVIGCGKGPASGPQALPMARAEVDGACDDPKVWTQRLERRSLSGTGGRDGLLGLASLGAQQSAATPVSGEAISTT